MSGGDLVADALIAERVPALFTLCGGHISPILVGAKQRGIRIVDVRHEASAVFAADAFARLTGIPGVAAVTAGPGVTNTITAVKNAQLAQSPVVILGGATATVLRGRGSLQDIDQLALFEPHVKWSRAVSRVRDLSAALHEAFRIARHGVPGPTFVECPIDVLYPEQVVRDWYGGKSTSAKIPSLSDRALKAYLGFHLGRVFGGKQVRARPERVEPPLPMATTVKRAAAAVAGAKKPVLVIGSQAMLEPGRAAELAACVERLGVPVYLSGMARGLLGARHPLQCRHRRRQALREADVVVLAGVPCDFRLDYGRHVGRKTTLVSANRSRTDLYKNRRPSIAVLGDPGRFLFELAGDVMPHEAWKPWLEDLRGRDDEREAEIGEQAATETDHVNPLQACRAIDAALQDDSVLVADGGDFVGTASYITAPRGPLRWLDPGVFGTLGVGGGFAIGAQVARPSSHIWILYGDGSCAYSLAEFDTYVRHKMPVIAIVGNDAAWAQIARDQVEILGDDVGTTLEHTAYHKVAEGYGGKGLLVERPDQLRKKLTEAKRIAAKGTPVLVNVMIGKTDFRKGSLSV